MKKIGIILILLIVFTSCNSKTGMDENINDNCEAIVLPKDKLANLLYSNDLSDIQFIDVRSPKAFSLGHLPNAINIPLENFFDKDRFALINPEAMLILYGEDASQPRLLALMASHFKKGNFYIAGGGYDYLKTNMIDEFGINEGGYDDERALIDIPSKIALMKASAGVQSTSNATSTKKATAAPVIKRKKKKAVSGGCG